VGVRFLISEAESIGLKEQFLNALEKMIVVVRGPKPLAALRQLGVRVDVIPHNPTTEGVIEALRSRDLQGRRVGVQLYGTPNPQLVSALEAKGAQANPVQVYGYGAAADLGAAGSFIGRILDGQVQVIAFTSAPQVAILLILPPSCTWLRNCAQRCHQRWLSPPSARMVTPEHLERQGLKPKIVPSPVEEDGLLMAQGVWQRIDGLESDLNG
jgi:uroporphyrinogen-III synthase